MLRMYFVQHWFNLADEACEEALLDSTALRRFVGIDLGRERVPDSTTLLKFRRKLGTTAWASNCSPPSARFCRPGLKVGTGTIVDATIIGAPSSTKNADKARDPEMRQTRKGSAVVLRHEAAHRGGQPHGAGAQRRGHRSERATSTAARSAARRRAARLWRQRLRQPEAAYRVKAPQARTSPTSAHAGAATSTRPCARRTAKSQVRAPRRARVRRGQAAVGFHKVRYRGLAKTPRARLWRWLWPTSSSREEHYMDRCVHSAHDKRTNGSRRAVKGLGKVAQCASKPHCSPRNSTESGVPREVATGWRLAATCSAFTLRELPVPVSGRSPNREPLSSHGRPSNARRTGT